MVGTAVVAVVVVRNSITDLSSWYIIIILCASVSEIYACCVIMLCTFSYRNQNARAAAVRLSTNNDYYY